MIRELVIHTTEPVTNADGTWIAATFTYHERLIIPYDDWVDIRSRPPAIEYLVDSFRRWQSTVPEMTFRVSPVVEHERDFSSDNVIFVLRSRGHFADNDDPRMREVLRLIDHPAAIRDDPFDLPVFETNRFHEVYRERSMFQPGTADNNPNPDLRPGGTTYMADYGPIHTGAWMGPVVGASNVGGIVETAGALLRNVSFGPASQSKTPLPTSRPIHFATAPPSIMGP